MHKVYKQSWFILLNLQNIRILYAQAQSAPAVRSLFVQMLFNISQTIGDAQTKPQPRYLHHKINNRHPTVKYIVLTPRNIPRSWKLLPGTRTAKTFPRPARRAADFAHIRSSINMNNVHKPATSQNCCSVQVRIPLSQLRSINNYSNVISA